MNNEKGQVLPLTLAVVAMGVLLITPLWTYTGTSLIGSAVYQKQTIEQFSADAAVEHAIWRLKYQSGFESSLTEANPTADYSVSVNAANVPVNVFMTLGGPAPPDAPEAPDWWYGLSVEQEVVPGGYVEPGVLTTFTYTLTITNTTDHTYKMKEIGDWLPLGFSYVSGSSSGIKTTDPGITYVDGRQKLLWTFHSHEFELLPGQVATQTFQATATLMEGQTYWNWAWFDATPRSGGSPTPVPKDVSGGQKLFRITSTASGVIIQADVMIDSGQVMIDSWKVTR